MRDQRNTNSFGKIFEIIIIDRDKFSARVIARLAQSAERKALNLVVVGSSPTVGVSEEVCAWGH